MTDGAAGGQSRSTLAAVRALSAAGWDVAVTRSGPRSLAVSSRATRTAIHTPDAGDLLYPDRVRAIADELRAITVLPSSDAALLALDLPGSSLIDKGELGRRIAAAGLPTIPQQWYPTGQALADASAQLPYPAVVKTARKGGSQPRPAAVVSSAADLAPWADDRGPVVVQPYLDLPMSAVFGICWQGDVVALGAQRYVRTWPPDAGVSCAAVTCPPPPCLPEDKLLQLLDGYDGIFQVQLVGNHVIDVNPRVYGSLPLAVTAGLNLPALWCQIRAGDAVPRQSARHGVWYRWLEGEVRWAWRAARRGDLRGVARTLRPRPGAAHAVWSLRDPGPTAMRLEHAVRRGRPQASDTQPRAEDAVELAGLSPRECLLASGIPPGQRPRHGIPTPAEIARRERAWSLLTRTLPEVAALATPTVLPRSWSTDIDVSAPVPSELTAWPHLISLDRLVAALGSSARGQWLIHEEGEGLARLDLQADSIDDPVQKVLDRCRRRREVRFREVLELRRLAAAGHELRDHPVVEQAAQLEASLGGAALSGTASRHAVAGWWLRHRPRRWRRPRAVVIAFSGLDGAGKSTQVSALHQSLAAAGIRVRVVWTRPGMHLGWLRLVRRLLKRVLGISAEPGLRAVSQAESAAPRSRRGVLGRAWRTVVMGSYLWAAWRPRVWRRGVVVYDRHLLDALATLHAVYLARTDGMLGRMMRVALPRADVSILLDVPVDVAAARKPDEVFSRHLLETQDEAYQAARGLIPDLLAIDATQDTHVIRELVLHAVAGVHASKRSAHGR